MIRCSRCGEAHDIFAIEPSFARPDAYLRIPPDQREERARAGDDWCRLRAPAEDDERFFLRVTLPVEVLGEGRRIHWGVWVEVNQSVYQRSMDLWDDTNQAAEAPLPGVLANQLPDYPSTLGLPGVIRLRGPGMAPHFYLQQDVEHALAHEQRGGVYPERIMEWVARFIH
jgi:hypothetical protein